MVRCGPYALATQAGTLEPAARPSACFLWLQGKETAAGRKYSIVIMAGMVKNLIAGLRATHSGLNTCRLPEVIKKKLQETSLEDPPFPPQSRSSREAGEAAAAAAAVLPITTQHTRLASSSPASKLPTLARACDARRRRQSAAKKHCAVLCSRNCRSESAWLAWQTLAA